MTIKHTKELLKHLTETQSYDFDGALIESHNFLVELVCSIADGTCEDTAVIVKLFVDHLDHE